MRFDALFNISFAAVGQVSDMPGAMAEIILGARTGTSHDPQGYRWTNRNPRRSLAPVIQQRQTEWMKQFAQQPTHK